MTPTRSFLQFLKVKHLVLKLAVLFAVTNSWANATFELTLTNGGKMPISPSVIYLKSAGPSTSQVGMMPSPGFVRLCETGDGQVRSNELRMDQTVGAIVRTMSPILPGDAQKAEILVADPQKQNIYVEFMYGKTKDICGLVEINSHSLVALKKGVSTRINTIDRPLSSGAYSDPIIADYSDYPNDEFCENSMNALSCLRELSKAEMGTKKIRFFAGYLPGIISMLEKKFGGAEVLPLIVSEAGSVSVQLKLK